MAGRRKAIATYNVVGGATKDRGRDPATQAQYDEFARRLQSLMGEKHWSQSELARRCALNMPKPIKGQVQNKDFGRDRISHYVNGVSMPRAESLAVLARTLGVSESDLVPHVAVPVRGEAPTFEIRTIADGRVSFHCNRTMSMALAMKITDLLRKEDEL